ncbi:oligosaccharide flippase family protein [Flavobacterium sp. MAH-1]|uniref:Oligosaccharide flippase family protein n=1 Tax=Flavobacterium agri TaxID=2743471 RepID=A0A7Y9C721_9FLAO|nr:oligosaccharide flippase family protein [Flavobacterium agri]NUY80868.1 oligosaccharide flippase family protein [Flavobacterium agri]NYA70892.1 oligosaccharide flippase family protein [Flavobacterium agri]
MSQLKKGAALSYVTIILTNGIGLLLTPFIIKHLGDSEYGLYTLIGSLIGTISVLDFGLNNTIVRFVAKFRAKQDRQAEDNFLATVMIIYGIISAVIAIVGIGLYFNLADVFEKLTPAELEKAKIMFSILIFNLAITLPGGAFTAICSAYEHFVYPRALNIIKYCVRSLMVVGLLLWGGDSVSIVVLDTVINVIVISMNAYYVLRILKARFKLYSFEMQLVREIFKYSIWIFIFAMVGQFQWRAGQLILGDMIGPKAVGIYGVGILLGTYYGAFSTAISGVFLPRATKMTVLEAKADELTDQMTRIGRFSLIILLMILGGFLLYGRQFVHLWVGDNYRDSFIVAIIIMFSYTLPLVQSFANSILEARSMFSFKAVTYISLIAIGTGIGAWLTQFYGLVGIIYGSAGGWILSQIIMNIYYKRVIRLEIGRFFKELFGGLLPAFLVILLIGYGIDFLPGKNWLNLVLKISAFGIVYCALVYKFGMNASERAVISSSIPFLKKKSHA